MSRRFRFLPRSFATILACGLLACFASWRLAAVQAAGTGASTERFGAALARVQGQDPLTCDELAVPDNPSEASLLYDAADGRLDEHSLLVATLVAGGHDAHTVRSAQRRIRDWAAELRAEVRRAESDRERAKTILEFLHQRVLTGPYVLTCSDVGQALDLGRYNCVNSTILFNALAEELGLQTAAVESPAHVYSIVVTTLGDIEVETTCPEWFELERRPAAQRARLAAKTGEQTAGQRWEGPRRRIGASGLTALVYYNRGVDLLEQKSFAGAVAANAKAIKLDALNAQAQGNLLAAINNWSLDAAGKGEHERAAKILDAGLRICPDHDLFHTNYVAIHQQWFYELSQAGQSAVVLQLLPHAKRQSPRQSFWSQAEADARRRLNGGPTR